jgi:predicted site-specific integrase-resolvase
MDDPNLMTHQAACELLGVHQGTLLKFIEAGELVPVVADAETYLRRDDLSELKLKREAARKVAVQELLELSEDE